MSKVHVPTAVPLGSITLPEDNIDYVSAASVNVPLQALADGVKCIGKWYVVSDFVGSFNYESGLVGSTCESLSLTEVTEFAGIPCSGANAVVKAGDRIVIDLRAHAVITGSQAIGIALLTARSVTSGQVQVYPLAVKQAVTEIDNFKASSTLHIPIGMAGVIDVDETSIAGADYLNIGIWGKVSALGGVLRINKPVWSRVQVLRSL